MPLTSSSEYLYSLEINQSSCGLLFDWAGGENMGTDIDCDQ